MRITIKQNDQKRTFIVKVQHDYTKPIVKHEQDEFGRDRYTIWRERKTTVRCHLWNEAEEPNSATVFVGTTVCKYQDNKTYKKSVGRGIAWCHCLGEMNKMGVFDFEAIKLLSPLTLDATSYEIDVDAGTVAKKN